MTARVVVRVGGADAVLAIPEDVSAEQYAEMVPALARSGSWLPTVEETSGGYASRGKVRASAIEIVKVLERVT